MYVPTQCKNNLFPSEPRKHCQRNPSQNILCCLKLPSGPPQIHISANPAGLLCVFLCYIPPLGILHWALLKIFLMSYYDRTAGCQWPREIKERREGERSKRRNRKVEGREERNTTNNARRRGWDKIKVNVEEVMSEMWIRSFIMSAKCSIFKLEQSKQLGFRFRLNWVGANLDSGLFGTVCCEGSSSEVIIKNIYLIGNESDRRQSQKPGSLEQDPLDNIWPGRKCICFYLLCVRTLNETIDCCVPGQLLEGTARHFKVLQIV